MSAKEEPADAVDVLRYYVDEAGDPTLFDTKGRSIVGNEGCSKHFILGKLELQDETAFGNALTDLRAQLLADPYFRRIPSMQPERAKTAVMFHAKDDVPEVRREVFRLLLTHAPRFHAVVRRKDAQLAYVRQRNQTEPGWRYKPDDAYDGLVVELFRRLHRIPDNTSICYARRGSRERSEAFHTALQAAEAQFESQYGFKRGAAEVIADVPKNQAGLQAVDYCLWALQRHLERGESRYLELIWPLVMEVVDLDAEEDGRTGITYNKKRPVLFTEPGAG